MYEGGFRHIPVVDDGHPVGILSAKDALGLDALQFESELVRREEIAVILRPPAKASAPCFELRRKG